jgi:hypothetical protein
MSPTDPTIDEDSKAIVPAACVACRSRHLKCDGVKPCARCVSRELDCSFVQSRRGYKATTRRAKKTSSEALNSPGK